MMRAWRAGGTTSRPRPCSAAAIPSGFCRTTIHIRATTELALAPRRATGPGGRGGRARPLLESHRGEVGRDRGAGGIRGVVRFEADIAASPPSVWFDLPVRTQGAFRKGAASPGARHDQLLQLPNDDRLDGRPHLRRPQQEVQRKIRVVPGRRVTVELLLDEGPPGVELPPTSAPRSARRSVGSSTGSLHHRKEYVRWIEGAKRDATRRARIEKAARMLRERIRHP